MGKFIAVGFDDDLDVFANGCYWGYIQPLRGIKLFRHEAAALAYLSSRKALHFRHFSAQPSVIDNLFADQADLDEHWAA